MSKTESSVNIVRKIFIDGFLLCGIAILMLATTYLWMPFQRGFFCGDESLMYPYKPDTVTESVLRIIQLAPIVIIFICEWAYLRHDTDDQRCFGMRIPLWLQGFYCTAMSFTLGVCYNELTVNIIKNIIGRARPHFLDVCKPSINCSLPEFQRRYIQTHEYTCTGDMVDPHIVINLHLSFVSGHSAIAAFSMVYLALYLENRLVWRGTRFVRHTLQYFALLVALFTTLSRVSDYKHHWSDVLSGFLLGSFLAIIMWTFCTDLLKKKQDPPQNNFDITLVSHQQVAVS